MAYVIIIHEAFWKKNKEKTFKNCSFGGGYLCYFIIGNDSLFKYPN